MLTPGSPSGSYIIDGPIILLDRTQGRPGVPRITDFGIARLANSSGAAATRAGSRLGTLPYMAPEQFRGDPVGPAADAFALGMLVWRLATGALPTPADDMIAATELYTGRRPMPSFASVRPALPRAVVSYFDACLSLNAADRPNLRELGALPMTTEERRRPSAPVETADSPAKSHAPVIVPRSPALARARARDAWRYAIPLGIAVTLAGTLWAIRTETTLRVQGPAVAAPPNQAPAAPVALPVLAAGAAQAAPAPAAPAPAVSPPPRPVATVQAPSAPVPTPVNAVEIIPERPSVVRSALDAVEADSAEASAPVVAQPPAAKPRAAARAKRSGMWKL